MRTNKQNDASKNNGAKSNGPVTPEGKQKSARNAVRHNLCTGHIQILSNENPAVFYYHRNDFIARFKPADGVELDLVERMIAASWRERRIGHLEAALFELEMDRQAPDIELEFDKISPAARQALALFGTDNTSDALALLVRYGSAARRSFSSAYRILRDLQGDRFNRTPVPLEVPPEIYLPEGVDPYEPIATPEAEPSESQPAATTDAQPTSAEAAPAPKAVVNAIATTTHGPILVQRRWNTPGAAFTTAATTAPQNTILRNEPETALRAVTSVRAEVAA